MKTTWLQKEGKAKLILFFNGWAMDEGVVAHLSSSDYDICMFHSYNSVSFPSSSEFENYSEVYVIAWSMGVWAAESLSLSNLPIRKRIAINGTGSPVSDSYGIPEAIYQGTIDSLSERNFAKFQLRMFGSKSLFDQFSAQADFDTQSRKDELIFIQENCLDTFSNWDVAILGTADRIYPIQNLRNYWKLYGKKLVERELPHFPFANFQAWEQIIEL